MTGNRAPRPSTIMDKIFDVPWLYRAKISSVKLITRPMSYVLFRKNFSDEQVILQAVPDGARVYEVGCGDGNGLRLFRDAGKHVHYTASDYNPHMVEYCRQHYPEASWEDYDGGRYPHEDSEFDFTIIRNVLHHIPKREDIVQTVREAARIAKKLILVEPLQSEAAPLRLMKSVYWRITDGGVSYFRLDELHSVFRDAGLRVEWETWTSPLRQRYAAILVRA